MAEITNDLQVPSWDGKNHQTKLYWYNKLVEALPELKNTPVASFDPELVYYRLLNDNKIIDPTSPSGFDTAVAQEMGRTGSESQTALYSAIAESARVNVKTFGVAGTGTVDDAIALRAAFDSKLPLIFPSGDYRVDSTVRGSFSGVDALGLPGARIFSNTIDEVLRLDATDGARFENIIFETTTTGAAQNTNGVVYSLGSNLRNVEFVRCTFKSIGRAINGLKVIADGSVDVFAVDNVYTRDCVFENGRMGFEVQDHAAPTVQRVRNVGAIDCEFRNNGNISQGIALSFSGPISSPRSERNKFYGGNTIAIEFAGSPFAPVAVDNEFYGLADTCQLISVTNGQDALLTANAIFERNRSIGRSGAGARFHNLIDARLSSNVILCKDQVVFRDCKRTESTGDVYDSTGVYALFVESNNQTKECSFNHWYRGKFSTAAGGNSVVRFYGAKAFRNKAIDCNLSRTAGVRSDQLLNASLNQLVRHSYIDTDYKPLKTIAMSDSDRTIGFDEMDCEAFVFTGTLTAARSVVFSTSERGWRVRNATSQTINLHAGGNGVTVTAGSSIFFSLDGSTAAFA